MPANKKETKSWYRKLLFPSIYFFLLLGGISLAYAAGRSGQASLQAEAGKLQAQVSQNEYLNYHNTKEEYRTNKERLEGLLEEVRDKLEDASASDAFYLQYQITSYESQIEEVDKKLRDATLQEMLYEYYDRNMDLITEKEVDKAVLADYQNAWKLRIYREQIDYLDLAREEAQARYDIALFKRDMGYALETEVQEAKLNLESVDIQYQYIEEEEQYLMDIMLVGSIPEVSTAMPSIRTEYAYYEDFLKNSTTHKYYLNQQAAYEEYGNTLKHTASPSDAERIAGEGAGLRTELAAAQQLHYEQKLKEYIHSQISTYRVAKKQYNLKEQEMDLCEEKQKRAELLYQQGEIQHVELLALEVQYAKLKLEALNYLSQANEAVYKLERCIEE